MVEHPRKIDLVIPCAGRGTRLKHLTKNRTKNMLKINGISILEHQINKFYAHKKKINKIHFILGYRYKTLKSYVLKLKLPYKIKFYINKKFKQTGCAYSLSLILKHINNDALILNSDLVLRPKIITNLLKIKKKNFVYLRKPNKNKKNRVIKARILRKKIVNIDILNQNFNFDVVGPFRVNIKSLLFLKRMYNSINKKQFLKMSCYTFLGKILNFDNINYGILEDTDWYEINTISEYKKSFEEKIFR